jgi:hypothetical protein
MKRDERTGLDRQTAALSQLTGILWRKDRLPPVKERGGSALGPVRNMFESRFFAASESNNKFMYEFIFRTTFLDMPSASSFLNMSIQR